MIGAMTMSEVPDWDIDADGYCLLCWDFCTSYEECMTNKYRNREEPRQCFMVEMHPPHGWQDGLQDFFCKGRTESFFKSPQQQWLW
jgi:hypothetical protein